MENLLDNLKTLLQKDERLVSEGEILKNKIIELVLKLDKDLIKLLLSDEKMKKVFFVEVDGTLIFDKDKFIKFVSNKQFLPDSYTAFKNKIGLIDEKGEFISEKKEVVLSWPYKDCVLEGGMTKEEQKRDEIFWNEILAPDEISRLLDPKVFTNAKRIDAKGEHLPAPRKKFYVYVIRCENESFYVGQTDDISKRWLEHKNGKVEWTKLHKPIEIVHYEKYENREQAVKREKELKTGFGRKWIRREFKAGRLKKWDENTARQAGKFDGFRTDENGDIKDNLIIKGNNLLALHSLKKRFAGKVKLIYIDPPYNREADTFYNDSFKHSSWLTFMKNRLSIAKELLKDDGVIFISIDDSEQAYLKVLCDEIFGRENFINVISIKTGESLRAIGGGESTKLKKKAEFITLYAKNKNSFIPNPIYEYIPLSEIIESKKEEGKKFEYNQVLISEGDKKPFDKFIDGQGNEIIIFKHNDYKIEKLDDFIRKNDIKDELEAYERFKDKIFRIALSESSIFKKVQEKIKQEFYSIEYIPRSGKHKGKLTKRFFYKKGEVIFLSETVEKINNILYRKEKLSNLWVDISWQGIMNEGGVTLKYGKKAEKLLRRIIEFSTNKNDLILDFFAGTGTTCAVAHKMGRQYIGVEQLDYGENSAVVRLKNVINGDQTGISKEVGWKGGGDFVYLELMKWNENFIEKIQNAKTKEELKKLWETMKEKAFLSYKVDIKTIDAHAKDLPAPRSAARQAGFEELSIKDQKKFLLECLDKNHLYVNYSEIDDEEYGVSGEDKRLNREFYSK